MTLTAEEQKRITAAAQSDPTIGLHRQFGERVSDARRQLAALEGTLRHVDELRAALKEEGCTVDVDLGAVGNAAASARRAAAAGELKPSFAMPKAGSVAA